MENKHSKSNGVLIVLILYIMVFGLKVKTNVVEHEALICEPIQSSIIDPPPTLPLFQKNNLEDKDYVIRKLVKHINALDTYIVDSNESSKESLKQYNDCFKQ